MNKLYSICYYHSCDEMKILYYIKVIADSIESAKKKFFKNDFIRISSSPYIIVDIIELDNNLFKLLNFDIYK